MEFTQNILKRCSKVGKTARNKSREEQAVIEQNLKEELNAISERDDKALNVRGISLERRKQGFKETLLHISQGLSPALHVQSFCYGVFFMLVGLVLLLSEGYLINWSLRPFGFHQEGAIIAISLTLATTLGIEIYFYYSKRLYPETYQRRILWIVVFALVCLIASGFTIALIRGVFMETSAKVQSDLTATVDEAGKFYQRTGYFPYVLGLIALGSGLILGVIIHANFPRLIISGNNLRVNKKLKTVEKKIERIKNQIINRSNIERLGLCEYRKALVTGRKGNFHHPLTIIILAILLTILLTVAVSGEEAESIIVLIDTSKSSLCKDYSGMKEFEKNRSVVVDIIKKLEPGSHLRVISIHENSFKIPSIILDKVLPYEKGSFGENIARAKLLLIRDWEKANIKATARSTDIIGALELSSVFFQGENGSKKLVIISDMRATKEVNLEAPDYIDKSLFDKVERIKMIPDLQGVRTWAIAVSSCGKTYKYWLSLKRFWEKFFKKSKAVLVSFSMERRIVLD